MHGLHGDPLVSPGTVPLHGVERGAPQPGPGRVHPSHRVQEPAQLHQPTLPPLGGEVGDGPPDVLLRIVHLGRAEPVLPVPAPHHVDQAVHDLAGVGGPRGGHVGQLPPPLPAVLRQLQALHAVQPLLVRPALPSDAADDEDGVI